MPLSPGSPQAYAAPSRLRFTSPNRLVRSALMARVDLTGAKIQHVFAEDASGKDFEQFFRRLLEAERSLRHKVGSAAIHGPTKFGKADGGKDCIFTVHEAPRKPRADFEDQLTWDEPSKIYYSLKTGKNWSQSVFQDVGYSGHLTGKPAKNSKKKSAKKSDRDKEPKPPKSGEILAHVAAGNRYVIVVSEPADDGQDILEKVRAALGYHMQREELQPARGWEQRIHFIEANVLAAFIRRHRPILPRDLDQKLGLDWPRELDRFDDWTRRFERKLPEYVSDQQREEFIDAVVSGKSERVTRVFGPPGVGKTRLVHRALERLDELALERDPDQLSRPTDAVYYTDSFTVAEDVIYERWLRDDAGAVILVADEVTSADAVALARNFLARILKERVRLVLIGVSDEDAYAGLDPQKGVYGVELDKLHGDATRKLVEVHLSGDKPELVTQILALAEGYPLFAILLAETLDQDEDALATGKTGEAMRWDAARRVLAGSHRQYGGDEVRWRAQATRRALCLLVVIMTSDLDLAWDALWESHGDDFRILIGEACEWQQVKSADVDCITRGLLRRVGSSSRRYVSPAILAQMILNHFFGDGPHDLGPRLARCNAGMQDRVHSMAQRFDASQSVRDKLSRGLLAEFERRRMTGEDVVELVDTRGALHIAVERLPDDTARVLSTAILDHEHEALAKQPLLRHGLRGVFQELAQQKLSRAAFAELEAALFAMARVEDERWANNATGIWRSLFLVAVSQTQQPWSVRFALLSRRCREGLVAERLVAISALSLVVASEERGLGHAPGHDWPKPNEAEYRARKRDAWELLLELCASESAAVAAAARETVAAKLRGCVMDDVAVDAAMLHELAQRVDDWEVAQRRHLAATLADIRRYDYAGLAAELRGAIDELEVRLNPSNFVERLVGQVGHWHPGPWPITEPQREQLEAREDQALVADALAHPQQLVAQWPWLASNAAVRRRPFMRALGRLDTSGRFLAELEAQGSELLSWYVEGRSQVASADVDAWLERQLGGGSCEHVATFVLPFLGPSDRRLEWIIDRVERGSVHVPSLSALHHRWVTRTSSPIMLRLIEACATRAECVSVGVGLAHELLDMGLDETLRERALDAAATLLIRATEQRLPASSEHDWQSLLSTLAQHGRSEAALEAMLALITSNKNLGMTLLIDQSLQALFEQGLAQALWQRATARLDGGDAEAITWHLAHARVLNWLPAEVVLEWVANRESRGVRAMSLVNPHGGALPELARMLLKRFGDGGPVAATLTERVRTLPRAVNSLLDFKRRQLANVELWARDDVAEIGRWAEGLAVQLREDIAEGEAHEAFRRKLG